jgi:molecular chaperone DnaK (HSP70)
VIGIDFGTTNTCAAVPGDIYYGSGATQAVNLNNGNDVPYNTVLASTVLNPENGSFDPTTDMGLRAQREYLALSADQRAAQRYLHAFKPRLDDQRLRERRYQIVGGRHEHDFVNEGDRFIPDYAWVTVGGEYSRSELVTALGRILDFVLGRAEEAGGERDQLVLGTPVSFSSRTRKRMLAALYATGRFASYGDLLRTVRFVHEPIAAAAEAMVDATDFAEQERVLVFDHGGGTLDLSLVEFEMREGFDHPVPVGELAAGGADDVAGRTIDHALIEELRERQDARQALDDAEEWDAADAIEGAKIALSTSEEATVPLGGTLLTVERVELERALGPTLARIELELDRVCRRAGISKDEVNRVVMTGGSSLVPAVQQTVRAAFPHLDGERLRSYDPADETDVERAITEVAQGLVRHAELNTLRHIVHWDIDLTSSESHEFSAVFRMGDEFDVGANGQRELVRRIAVRDENRDGMCFGLYEHQLDRTFVFGLADVPPHHDDAELEVTLRHDAAFPALRLLDRHGHEIAVADLQRLEEEELRAFFDCDVEYLPDTPFERFSHAPLARKLKEGDEVEWTRPMNGGLARGRGEIWAILRDDGRDERVPEMDSWELDQFRLFVRGPGGSSQFIGRHGYVRLASRPELR